jgi:hypothetical protein
MRVRCAAGLAVVFGLAAAAAAEVRYSVTVLGAADPGPDRSLGINDLGQVAGTLYSNSSRGRMSRSIRWMMIARTSRPRSGRRSSDQS